MTSKDDFSRYKDFFEEADDQKVRKKGGSKKVQFKDEPDEPEVDDKNDDGNVSQVLDLLTSI